MLLCGIELIKEAFKTPLKLIKICVVNILINLD